MSSNLLKSYLNRETTIPVHQMMIDLCEYVKDMADIQPDVSFNFSCETMTINFLHQYNTSQYLRYISGPQRDLAPSP